MIRLSENKMSYGIENELCGLSLNLNYMNTHTHIIAKKGTMGQFGPMVLKYNKDFIMQCNTLTIKPVHVVLVKESSTYEYI